MQTATLLLVASLTLVSAIPYQVTVVRLDNINPGVCYGAIVGGNMILTPAQCVAHAQPQDITIRTQSGGHTAFAIARIIVNDRFNLTTLYPDVALLQLQNATRVTATGARSIKIDWQQQHWADCTVNIPQNTTGGPDRPVWFADVHRPCDRFNGRNLTTCTGYELTNMSQCANTSIELNVNRGTPLVCGGYLTGHMSSIVQPPRAHPLAPCPTNGTAYYTRYDRVTAEWMKLVINTNRSNGTQSAAPQHPVMRWPSTGAHAAPQPKTQQQHGTEETNRRLANGNGKRSGASSERCSTVGVVMGLVMFGVLSYV